MLTISRAVPYLTVVNVERQSYLQDVAYSVEYVDDPDMYEGDYEVLSKGVYGKADITANVTVINGTETAREVVSSVTLKEPVAERQARGTKERPTWFPTGSFRWPCYGVITSYFGGRNTGISGASSYHEAIDIANSYGTPIYAADGGTVIYSGWNGGLGYCVKIDHGNGFITWYGHNSDLYVSVGDHVYKGQTIAAMGSTGISSGSHCDFRIQRNGTMVSMISMKSSPAYAGELFAARRERRRQSLQHRGKPKACWPRASAQRPQHHAVHHAGQCAVDDHRAGNDEHFGRHAGDKALCLEIQRRGYHGIGKARDGHQRPGPAEPGQPVVKSQSRQQRRQEYKGHRRGGPGVLRIQARRPEAVSDSLSRHTDEPADDEGQHHILSQRGLLLHPLHIRLILLGRHVHPHHILSSVV